MRPPCTSPGGTCSFGPSVTPFTDCQSENQEKNWSSSLFHSAVDQFAPSSQKWPL